MILHSMEAQTRRYFDGDLAGETATQQTTHYKNVQAEELLPLIEQNTQNETDNISIRKEQSGYDVLIRRKTERNAA